ncbi:MAG: PCP reductase family protein [Gemmatimonadota bacterium]
MRFLCVACDQQMVFEQRQLPGDGTLAAAFRCPRCEQVVAMLTNPMETQLVSSLGIKIGGRDVPEQPLELVRSEVLSGREDAFVDSGPPAVPETAAETPGTVVWSLAAVERLEGVPRFVRGMVKRIYADYAKENGISEITPEIMDRARSDLGLEGM